jgi:hypothetical protein
MTKQKLTEWFPADIKPVRKGVYIRDLQSDSLEIFYGYFDGYIWGCTQTSIKAAYEWRNTETSYPNLQWRGIAK